MLCHCRQIKHVPRVQSILTNNLENTQFLSRAAFGNHEEVPSATALSAAWRQRHLGVKATSFPKVTAGTRRSAGNCYQCGVCHCKAGSPLLNRFFGRVHDFFRGLSEDQQTHKKLLDGFIVLHWHGRVDEASTAPSQPSSSTSASPSSQASLRRWTHMPLQYISPWRPTFLELTPTPPDQHSQRSEGSIPDSSYEYVQFGVKTTRENAWPLLWNAWALVADLGVEMRWTLEAWELSTRSSPCVLHGHIVAKRLNHPARTVWEGELTEQQARRRPQPATYDAFEDNRPHPYSAAEEEEAVLLGAFQEFDEPVDTDSDVELHMSPPSPERAQNCDAGAMPPPQLQEAEPDAPQRPEELAPLHLLEHPGSWGAFGFSLKKPHGNYKVAYEITCPYHRLSGSALCKKNW